MPRARREASTSQATSRGSSTARGGSGGVDSPGATPFEHAPVPVRPQHAAPRPGDGLPLTVLLPDPSLDMGGGGGALEPQESAGPEGHLSPERIDGQHHAPMEDHMVVSGSALSRILFPKEIYCDRPEGRGAVIPLRSASAPGRTT